jgi:putative phosphoesterase
VRVAIIADVHGNALALEAVLADIVRQKVDAIANLGDHLSGPLEPGLAAELLMGISATSIRGNHDRYLLTERPAKMDRVDAFTLGQLREDHINWLEGQPKEAVVGDEIYLCHGTPTSDDVHWLQTKDASKRFFFTPVAQIEADAQALNYPVICCGHSHVARVVTLADGRIVVNPGSVGRPAYTMVEPESAAWVSPAAGYAIATKSGPHWSVTLRQVAYDHERAASIAVANGFSSWSEGLARGWQR